MLFSEALISVLAIYGVMMTRVIMNLNEEEEEEEEGGEVVTHSYQ
jgi:hypothetical protein